MQAPQQGQMLILFNCLILPLIQGLTDILKLPLLVVLLRELLLEQTQVMPTETIAHQWDPGLPEVLRKTNGYLLLLKVCSWKLKQLPGDGCLVTLKRRMKMPLQNLLFG